MALKDILIHLDNTARSAVRLDVAVALARRHEARLTGIGVIDLPSVDLYYGSTMPFSGIGPEDLVQRMRTDAAVGLEPVGASFGERLRREGLEGEWRLVEGHMPPTVALHARYADLTIVGQPNRDEPLESVGFDAMVAHTIMTSGRPVLAVPYAGTFPVVGDRILVAWNAGREAARAINDALPLLQAASAVTVLAINPRHGIAGHGDVPAADMTLHLVRHGVKAEAAHTVANDISDGEALLSYAADIGADLIVAGAYGHSRAREMVFGGVTRTLLAEMTVPVLFSH
jgi:nucleotide-binding universal stress UspA family protein